MPRANVLPASQEIDNHVGWVALEEQLRNEVQVRDESRLEDNRHVRGVEELDWVGALLATGRAVLHREIHTETLEVDYDQENDQSGHELDHVRKVVLPVEGLTQCTDLVTTCDEQVEEGDDSTSNSVPRFVWRVMGEKAFQMIDSQMFVAMKREIPDPRP